MPRQQQFAVEPMSFGAPLTLLGEENLALWAPTQLAVYQGDDVAWLFRLKTNGGAPFDLTGYTAACQFRTAVADDDHTPGVTLDLEISDATNGEILMTLQSEKSVLLIAEAYVWDLEITETAESWTTTIAGGTVAVTKEVTRVT